MCARLISVSHGHSKAFETIAYRLIGKVGAATRAVSTAIESLVYWVDGVALNSLLLVSLSLSKPKAFEQWTWASSSTACLLWRTVSDRLSEKEERETVYFLDIIFFSCRNKRKSDAMMKTLQSAASVLPECPDKTDNIPYKMWKCDYHLTKHSTFQYVI